MTSSASNSKPDVLLIWPNRPRQMAILEETYNLHRYDLSNDPDAFLKEIGERITSVATTGGKGLTAEQISLMPNLKIVSSSGVGYDSIDITACTRRGIKVTNTPGVLTNDVADTAIMLIISTLRQLVKGDRWVRSGDFIEKGLMPLTTSVTGKKLGIVGMGSIGQAIAARALPLGLEISYFGPNEKTDVLYCFTSDLITLAEWADILVLSCPGGETTRDLIDTNVLNALGKTGTLINVARGSVVNQPALLKALSSNAIAGAGLDVYANEPHGSADFVDLENVVLYPHLASGTVETRDAMAQLVCDNLEAFFAGKPLLTPVN